MHGTTIKRVIRADALHNHGLHVVVGLKKGRMSYFHALR